MVCLADAEYIQAVITDTIGDGPKKQSSINLAPSKLVDNVFNEVALDFHYQPDAFTLSIENEDEEIILNMYRGKTLGEVGVKFDQNAHSRLIISSLKTPKNVCFTQENDTDEVDDNSYLNYCKSKSSTTDSTEKVKKKMNLSVNETATNSEEIMLKFDFVLPSYSLMNDFNNTMRDDRRNAKTNDSCKMEVKAIETNNYVGLVNQAMTCYLNSLLQALYMTPEFRNALYNWEFDGQNETRSIPFQLQKLFLNLQTSTKSAVETTDLTTSFGWQGSEAWQQHDIQELCRVMFDALEQKFKSTKQANLINDLYEGKMLDYVKCLECSTEKSREDTFLDIPLPVRPFGSAVAYNSVEEALRAFVQPETLNGNNQYFCEKCNKKCDAHKGLKFTKFPYLLTLHLKRFDFDYNTMHRIKLNDKVVFPEILNLNSFIFPSNNTGESDVMEERETIVKCDDSSTTSDSGSALDDESCQGADNLPTVINGQEDANHEEDEGIDMTEAKGPYIYELFSIMIHSGSASGGHYYAYIKDFAKNQWFCFNDMNVSIITEEDIKKTYGGGPQRGYYSSAYSSSTNAYMLMYRQIEKERNCNAMTVEDFPPHLQKLLQQMREKEECDRLSKEKENDLIKMKIYCELPIQNQLMYTKIATFIESTLEEVTKEAYTRFKLEGIVPLEDCRLVSYNKNQDYIDCSFESDELRLCDITNSKFIIQNDWLLEIKQSGSQFQTYKPGGVNMKVFVINLETEEVDGPVNVRVNAGETVGEFRTHLAHLLNMDLNTMKVVKETYSNEPQLLEDDDAPMKFDPSYNGYKIYVSQAIDEDPEQPFILSHLHKVIDRFVHIISINIVLPDTNIGTLESLSIPPLDFNQNLDKIELAGGDRMNSSPNLNVSPQPGGICSEGFGDQSNSEDSSLSDSDRTLVGDAPGDCLVLLSSSSNSPADQHMASPSDPAEDTYNHEVFGNPSEDMNWEMEPEPLQRCTNYYFKVTSCMSSPDSTVNDEANRFCKVLVDKRMTLCKFKKHLEPIVGVPVDYFKIYRQYPNQDDEWSRLKDTLGTAKDGERLIVKLGRVLKKDEYSGKIYHFSPNGTNIFNLLFEHIITKGQTVGQVKKDIIFLAKKQHMLDIPYTKSCLRKKSWKNPTKIYLDEQKFVDDVNLGKNFELCIQELEDGSDKMTSPKQLGVFVRRWNPSSLILSPFSEIILDTPTMDELKKKVSEKSGIPLENVDIAFLKLSFPCDMNVLEVHDLEWNPSVTLLEHWPLQIYEDGNVFFYRDNREALKELTQEEKKEINQKENTRLGRYSSKTYSPGRERGLKIYLDTSPSKPKETCSD